MFANAKCKPNKGVYNLKYSKKYYINVECRHKKNNMAQKITTIIEGNRLRQISKYEEMLSDDYLSNLKIAQTAFIYEKFFKGGESAQRQERLDLLNISYSIPLLISERLADYVGEPSSPYEELDLFNFVFDYSWGGYSVMKCRKVDSKFVIEHISPDGYILCDDGSEQLLSYLLKENDSGMVEQYVLVQTYTKGVIQNELYKLDVGYTDGSIKGSPVPLATLEETSGILEEEKTGFKENPIVVTHNTKISSTKYGDSDIRKVRSLITSIEVQAVNIQDQMLKHLQAKLAIPVSKMPINKKTGLVDISKLEVIGMENGDPHPMYVTNTNPLIEKSFEQIEKFIIQIATILAIPIEFFGIKAVGGAESEGTKIIRLSPFIKHVERVRKAFNKSFKKIEKIAKGFNVSIEDTAIVWGDVFPKNKASEADELSIALDSRLISLKKAIMRYQGISAEEAEKEVKIILKENADITVEELGV